MKLNNIKKFALTAVFGAGLVVVSGIDANAQGNSQWAREQNRIRKEQRQYQKTQRQAAKHYRVYRNGSYYQTDQRGAQLLRQAVENGYRQGYQAGANDRRYNRNGGYYGSNVYRSGTYGYQSYVDRGQYQHYFQQGFQRGYQDGVNSQTRYGVQSNNSVNILGTILNGILNIREF